jgi:hypothetical protein
VRAASQMKLLGEDGGTKQSIASSRKWRGFLTMMGPAGVIVGALENHLACQVQQRRRETPTP